MKTLSEYMEFHEAALVQEAEGPAPRQAVCLPYFLGEKSPINDPMLRGRSSPSILATPVETSTALHSSQLHSTFAITSTS
jgi:ribulose kinase